MLMRKKKGDMVAVRIHFFGRRPHKNVAEGLGN